VADPKLSLVVVNYRTPQDLQGFLQSYDKHPPRVEHELTIVNVEPASIDVHVALSHGSRYVEFPTNVGYARACNSVARHARGDVVAFFNADVRITPGALDRCYQALMETPGWGVLGPRQVDDRGRLTHAGILGSNKAPLHRGWYERDQGQYQDVREAVTISGSAYFVKCSVWRELTICPLYRDFCSADGAFLPTQHYYEETYASYHARAHGWQVMYFGEVTLVHLWHRASPLAGHADAQMPVSRELFRRACDAHGIDHD
jgi:GT2 family glycosyltransferase